MIPDLSWAALRSLNGMELNQVRIACQGLGVDVELWILAEVEAGTWDASPPLVAALREVYRAEHVERVLPLLRLIVGGNYERAGAALQLHAAGMVR